MVVLSQVRPFPGPGRQSVSATSTVITVDPVTRRVVASPAAVGVSAPSLLVETPENGREPSGGLGLGGALAIGAAALAALGVTVWILTR